MANRLMKEAGVTYAVGTPAVPPTEAWCSVITTGTYRPTYYVTDSGQVIVTGQAWVETVTKTCYPALPGRRAVAPLFQLDAMIGWNSGGHSIGENYGDAAFSFVMHVNASAEVVGIGPSGSSTNPATITHGFHLSLGTLSVWESGQLVAQSPAQYAGETLEIIRFNGQVTLRHGGWSYTSVTQSSGPVVLDASLYAAGDFVDDPQIVNLASGSATIEVMMIGSDSADLNYGFATLEVEAHGEGLTGNVGDGSARIEIDAIGADVAGLSYGSATVIIEASGTGGAPAPSIAYGGAYIELEAIGFGMTGNVGSGSASVEIMMVGSDVAGYAYGSAEVVIEASGLGGESVTGGHSYLLIGATGEPSATFTIESNHPPLWIGAAGSPVPVFVADQDSPGLMIAATGSPLAIVTMPSDAPPLYVGASGGYVAQLLQILMNMATGAVTECDGLDFDGFVQTPSGTYGWGRDGLHLIETGGARDVFIDLGAQAFGSTNQKGIDLLYVMADTDVAGSAIMSVGDTEYTDPIHHSRDASRVQPGRGLIGREFRIKLNYAGAKQFRLDGLRYEVRETQRIKR